jgi:hypothetical protein
MYLLARGWLLLLSSSEFAFFSGLRFATRVFLGLPRNNRTNLTQVKRHVMQEYMRQKKRGTRQSESEEEVVIVVIV